MTTPPTTHPARRGLLLTLSAAVAAVTLPPAPGGAALPPDKAELARRVEAYLNGVRTLSARFSQVNPDGSFAAGTFHVDRTRSTMRFDYDPPSKILLVAPGDWRLIFADGAVKQVNVLPVGETPLGFLLGKQIRLEGGDADVSDVAREQGEIVMTVGRAGARDQGRVRLAFTERPIELRRWAVTDPQGLTTVVILEGLVMNGPIDPDLFVWRDPKMFGWPDE